MSDNSDGDGDQMRDYWEDTLQGMVIYPTKQEKENHIPKCFGYSTKGIPSNQHGHQIQPGWIFYKVGVPDPVLHGVMGPL